MIESDFILLFDNMISPFSYYRMVYDKDGNPVNYVFLSVNRAFEMETGLKRELIIGKNVLDVLPQTEQFWVDRLGKVAKTGIPDRFEDYASALGNRNEHVRDPWWT